LNYSRAGLRKPRRRGGAAAANESSGVLAVGSDGRREDLEEDEYKVGVLLLNLGGPETLDDVQPFLYNLFADPSIIRLPGPLRLLQGFLANVLSSSRAPKSREAYESIGGGSPLRRITEAQARALQTAMETRGIAAKAYVGMRYWKPFTEDAIEAIKRDGVNRLVVLPLYPQFSISTSGSSLRLLEQYFSDDEELARVRHTVIPSWYQRPGYIKAMAAMIAKTLREQFDDEKEPIIFFSAHGVPTSYVEEAGDPYKDEMEACVRLIVDELRDAGVDNEHVLAYQSRVGPVEWLKPYTDDTIRELGRKGTKALCAVPISFVSEHIETLEEIDMEYRELAEESGVEKWGRVPALDTDPLFIDDLADAVIESLPYTSRMNKRRAEEEVGLDVPPSEVGQILAAYDLAKLAMPVPDSSLRTTSSTKRSDEFTGSTGDLVNVAIVVFIVFVFLQYVAGANGLFGSYGVFSNW
tara:strand:+ start:157 stop:1557 length:1401 start_codon:yes stop_codon:yes gene_type:complete